MRMALAAGGGAGRLQRCREPELESWVGEELTGAIPISNHRSLVRYLDRFSGGGLISEWLSEDGGAYTGVRWALY